MKGEIRLGEEKERDELVKCNCEGFTFFVPRKQFLKILERTPYVGKKYVRPKEAALMFGMCEREVRRQAEKAGAVSVMGRMIFINVEKMDSYLMSR